MVAGNFNVEYIFRLKDLFSMQADKIIASFKKINDAATTLNKKFMLFHDTVNGLNHSLKFTHRSISDTKVGLNSLKNVTVGVTHKVQALNTQVSGLATRLREIGRGAYHTGLAGLYGVTLPVVGAGVAAVRASMSIQDQQNLLKRLVNDLKPGDIERYTRNAIEVSKKTPIKASQYLETMGTMSQYGIKKEYLEGMTMTAEKAVVAFEMEGQRDTALSAFGKVANIYKMDPKKLERLTQYINWISDTAGFGVSEAKVLRGGMQKTFAMASAYGMSAEKGAALSAGIQLTGLGPERGGSVLNSMFMNLSSRKKMSKIFGEEAGGKFADEFMMNPSETLIKVLKTVAAQGDTLKGKHLATAMFGSYAPNASQLAKLAPLLEKAFKADNTGKFTGGLEAAFKLNMEKLSAQLKIFMQNLEALAITLGDHITKYLQPFLTWLNPQLAKLNTYLSNAPDWVKTTILVTAGIAAMIPLLILFGSTLATAAGTIMIAQASLAGGGVAGAAARVGMGLGRGTSSAAAMAALLAGKNLAPKSGNFITRGIGAVGNYASKTFLGRGALFAGGLLGKAGGAVGGLLGKIPVPAVISNMVGGLIKMMSLSGGIFKIFGWIVGKTALLASGVGEVMLVMEILSFMFPGIKKFMDQIYGIIWDAGAYLGGGLFNAAGAVFNQTVEWWKMLDHCFNIVQNIKGAFDGINNAFTNMARSMESFRNWSPLEGKVQELLSPGVGRQGAMGGTNAQKTFLESQGVSAKDRDFFFQFENLPAGTSVGSAETVRGGKRQNLNVAVNGRSGK
jgi:TP901 family phage tail tape measure protein